MHNLELCLPFTFSILLQSWRSDSLRMRFEDPGACWRPDKTLWGSTALLQKDSLHLVTTKFMAFAFLGFSVDIYLQQ